MKTHRYARFSLSLKLVVGLLEFEQRRNLHSMYLEQKIAELNLAVHPGLITGVLAGVYPAWRAARMKPVEALRHG
jgi:ABC-type lipoprotein release transport system permease subunit